jgi:hypothetical protein
MGGKGKKMWNKKEDIKEKRIYRYAEIFILTYDG